MNAAKEFERRPITPEQAQLEARSLLAAEYEQAQQFYEAGALRDGGPTDPFLNDKDIQAALRAITAALLRGHNS